MTIPTWLTKEFLEKLLEANQDIPDSKIEILNYDMVSALPKGNNYASNILRINIEYLNSSCEKIKNISLIAKVPLDGSELDLLNKAGIIEKEFEVYTELLPKLHKVLLNAHDNTRLSGKMFKSDVEHAIILEDLKARGYLMADRKKQLDYDHGVLVLEYLAKFHAASVKLHEIEPEVIERFGIDLFLNRNIDEEIKEMIEPFMGEQHIEKLCAEFEKWPETKKFVDFLTKLKPKIWDVLFDCLEPEEGEFTVLNHGDAWTTNMLFKYDETEKPIKLKLLDFQILRLTSPAPEILYFLHSSIRYEVLKAHFQDFIDIYFEHLNRYLEAYGSSRRLEKEEFNRSLEKREIFSLMQCINVLPFTFGEYHESEEEEKTVAIPLDRFIQNEKFRNVAVKYLEDFSRKPWFQNFE